MKYTRDQADVPSQAPENAAATVFAMLPGYWRLCRWIPGHGSFSGHASVSAGPAGRLTYSESGTLQLLNGKLLQASREYIYALTEGGITVSRPGSAAGELDTLLHELDFCRISDGYVAEHVHECGEDRYEVTFTAQPPDWLRIEYRVRGPQKDYDMSTEAVRELHDGLPPRSSTVS